MQKITLAISAQELQNQDIVFDRMYPLSVHEQFLRDQEDKRHNLSNHSKWLSTKIILNHLRESIAIINKWHICLVDYGMNIGTEINGIRPSIIFKSGPYKYGEDTIVIPITSYEMHDEGLKSYGDMDIIIEPNIENGLSHRSLIKIRQMRSISKKRLRRHKKTGNIRILGSITDSTIRSQIEKYVIAMLGLGNEA